MSRCLDRIHVTIYPPPQRAPLSKAISSSDFETGRPGPGGFQKCESSCEHLQPALL